MPTIRKTYYKVTLKGEVIIEAIGEDDALTQAKNFFVTTGQGLAWAVEKVDVQVSAP